MLAKKTRALYVSRYGRFGRTRFLSSRIPCRSAPPQAACPPRLLSPPGLPAALAAGLLSCQSRSGRERPVCSPRPFPEPGAGTPRPFRAARPAAPACRDEVPPAAASQGQPLPDAEARGADGSAEADAALPEAPRWNSLEDGLEYAEFSLQPEAGQQASLTVLRIDPELFDFRLYASAAHKHPALTLGQWADSHDLVAAINASMYLPDGVTSTGYMRQDDYINNKRLVRRFGAFFVAGPRQEGLPRADILTREDPQWQDLLEQYRLVIQNYRMINDERRILWSPGGPLYAISAVAEDGAGKILFLHCREPLEAYSFAHALLHLPLDVRTVMYVEGGMQAGLVIRSPGLHQELRGRHLADFWVTGNVRAQLPNVLGIRRRHAPALPDCPTLLQKTAPAPAN